MTVIVPLKVGNDEGLLLSHDGISSDENQSVSFLCECGRAHKQSCPLKVRTGMKVKILFCFEMYNELACMKELHVQF